MSYTQIHYHIVFSTKRRSPVLAASKRKKIFAYLWGILNNKRCHLYRANGAEDHVHFLIGLHPSVDLSSLIRDLKTHSTAWIKRENLIPDFPGWQDEYAAFTKSRAERDTVIEYIKNQDERHRKTSSIDELRTLLREEGIEFDERYLK